MGDDAGKEERRATSVATSDGTNSSGAGAQVAPLDFFPEQLVWGKTTRREKLYHPAKISSVEKLPDRQKEELMRRRGKSKVGKDGILLDYFGEGHFWAQPGCVLPFFHFRKMETFPHATKFLPELETLLEDKGFLRQMQDVEKRCKEKNRELWDAKIEEVTANFPDDVVDATPVGRRKRGKSPSTEPSAGKKAEKRAKRSSQPPPEGDPGDGAPPQHQPPLQRASNEHPLPSTPSKRYAVLWSGDGGRLPLSVLSRMVTQRLHVTVGSSAMEFLAGGELPDANFVKVVGENAELFKNADLLLSFSDDDDEFRKLADDLVNYVRPAEDCGVVSLINVGVVSRECAEEAAKKLKEAGAGFLLALPHGGARLPDACEKFRLFCAGDVPVFSDNYALLKCISFERHILLGSLKHAYVALSAMDMVHSVALLGMSEGLSMLKNYGFEPKVISEMFNEINVKPEAAMLVEDAGESTYDGGRLRSVREGVEALNRALNSVPRLPHGGPGPSQLTSAAFQKLTLAANRGYGRLDASAVYLVDNPPREHQVNGNRP